jgi:hypothetical protein
VFLARCCSLKAMQQHTNTADTPQALLPDITKRSTLLL